MEHVEIAIATSADLPRLTEIYNDYVRNTSITFDVEPFAIEDRRAWFEEHRARGRYRLLVARLDDTGAVGYASTSAFRAKPAYDTTVEASVYCAPGMTGRGIGTRLYGALFEAIAEEDIHRILAAITLPNDPSVALHMRFGFRPVGTFSQSGRKLGRYWDVLWMERPLRLASD